MRTAFRLLSVAGMMLFASLTASPQSSTAPSPKAEQSPSQSAADAPDPDEQAIHNYLLTLDKVQKYAETSKKLRDATTKDAALSAEVKKITDADVSDRQRIGMVASSPKLYAFLKGSGINARDFVLLPMTVMTAGFALSMQEQGGQVAPFVNLANIIFVKDHKKDLEDAGFMQKEDTSDSNSNQ
jgi:hypothetical protein